MTVRGMNRNVIISCAVTGSGDTAGRSEHVPVTPKQIAESALDAAKAGATIVHCHVRDLETGKGTRTVAHYQEVVERIREQDDEVVVNLTAGMGGDLVVGPDDDPMAWQEGTDVVGGIERLAHVDPVRDAGPRREGQMAPEGLVLNLIGCVVITLTSLSLLDSAGFLAPYQ